MPRKVNSWCLLSVFCFQGALASALQLCVGSLVLVLLCFGVVSAQELQVPISTQVPLMLKATRYDRNFGTKQGSDGTVTVGICYQAKYPPSVSEMASLQEQFTKGISGFRLKVVMVAVTEMENLSRRKEWADLSIVYLTTMEGIDLEKLLAVTRAHGVMSVCTQPANVEKGVTMGFDKIGGRAHFVINRGSSKLEGCDFSSQLLKLATVY
jgi:hypothetical protein